MPANSGNVLNMSEVSDAARARFQRVHDCFFGRPTLWRLQFFEICQPLSHLQQKLCLVFARNWFREALGWVPLCVKQCWQGFLVRYTNRRQAHMEALMLKPISCASCLSTTPCRDRSAGCPKTFLTSSVPNSRLSALAHVLSLTMNQSCHAFAVGKPRAPVGILSAFSCRFAAGCPVGFCFFAGVFCMCLFSNCTLDRVRVLSQSWWWDARWKSHALTFAASEEAPRSRSSTSSTCEVESVDIRYLQQRWAQPAKGVRIPRLCRYLSLSVYIADTVDRVSNTGYIATSMLWSPKTLGRV